MERLEELAVEYAPDQDAVWARRGLPNAQLLFKADGVRREHSGIHARVTVGFDTHVLAYDTFNLARREDRVRLAKDAAAGMNGDLQHEYAQEYLKHDLDVFCRKVWPVYQCKFAAKEMAGTEPEPMPFILEPYVIEGAGTILFGHPGKGKSFMAGLLEVSIDAGVDRLWPVTQKKVLHINLERSERSVARRLGAINSALGLPRNRPLLTINARGKTLQDVTESILNARRTQGVEVGFLDSISRSGFGDLNENRPMNAVIDMLNATLPTWFALAHAPRHAAEHVFGSIMLDAGADVIIQLLSDQQPDVLGLGLKVTKGNDIGPQPTKVFKLSFDPIMGLQGVEPAKVDDFPAISAQAADAKLEDLIADFLEGAGRSWAGEIAENIEKDRTAVARELKNNKRFVVVGKEDKRLMYGMRASRQKDVA